jgi:hypothetical protein
MTLLMFNGFEGNYDTPVDQKNMSDGILSLSGTQSAWQYDVGGRNGGKALKSINATWDEVVNIKFPGVTNDKLAIVGFAIKFAYFGSTDIGFLGDDYSGDGGYVSINSNGDLIGKVKAFGIQASERINIKINQWYYIELKMKLHSSAGVCVIKVNEQVLLDYTGYLWFSGEDLTTDRFWIKGLRNSGTLIDDVYVADNQGTENNDFLGDIRVDNIHPNGAGNYAQLTPSAGANYECVDEVSYDDSDYVEGINAGEKDSYTYGSVPTDLDDAGIIGLQIKNNSKRTATADNIKIDSFIRTGSTDYSQTVQDLPDAFGMVGGDIVLDDPSDSNPWTQAKINACEFGMEVA